ncbi:carboxylesterase/lipase family protein [Croceibacterium mercuriale]|uniref:carboxylesterase/lipase family protein n=1 Tax=Croceibacterium mercuriale TaxID=1572751 RepID=UPI001F1942CF|nr:carboxylesterase family protein [Croceibacterium mercuriale]
MTAKSRFRTSAFALANGMALMTITAPAAAQEIAPVVRIDAGQVEGKALPSGVNAFLGIPYAAPPVRDLRWRDPAAVQPFAATFHADRYAPQCPQPSRNAMANQYSGAEVTSEDCLYLNVWAKPGLTKAPVIVFIHGGAFFIGAGSMPIYGGETVAQRGAVFVNLNYRLGVLGFLAHPDLSQESPHQTSGNYGFLDQIAALRWVHDNIAQFGGDPDNVTIAGQSAGSMAVLALQASPLAAGLFQRAVGMSGAAMRSTGPFALRPLPQGEAEGLKFQQLVNADSLAEMRNLPVDRLTLPRVPGAPAIGAIQDGHVLTAPIETTFAEGKQNDVPLLLGFTRDEALGGFGAIDGLADYRERAAERFGERADLFLTLYPAQSDQEARMQARLADRDSTMVAPMFQWALAQGARGRAPVYSYMYAHPHSYAPDVTFSDLDPATAGAYHTSEVPFWLGTLDSFNQYRHTRAWTADDQALSTTMTEALIAFARNGNPAGAGLDFRSFDKTKPELLKLDTVSRQAPWPDSRKLAFFYDMPLAPIVVRNVQD